MMWLCLAALLVSGCSAKPRLTVTGMGEYQTETQDWQEQDLLGKQTRQFREEGLRSQQSQKENVGTSSEDGVNETAEAAGTYLNGTADTVPDAIVVYVCGAVAAPGVYQLPPSARVYEAVAAAGGFLPDADEEWYNQAKKLQDGEMIRIYTRDETAALTEQGEPRPEGQEPHGQINQEDGRSEGQININTADMEQLMTLPGIGEAKAEAILAYRQEHGRFQTIEEIMQISGIKEAVFAKIKGRITV